MTSADKTVSWRNKRQHRTHWLSYRTYRPLPGNIPFLHKLRKVASDEKLGGWLSVFAGLLLLVPMMGVVTSFGELLHPLMELYDTNLSTLSWVGSLAFGTAYVANPLSAPVYRRFTCRWTALTGVLMGSLGLFMTSYVQAPWLLFFTYSLTFGLATNLCYNPPLILVGEWFPVKYHVLSTCTMVVGIPFGSLVMNPVIEVIIRSLGLQDGLRVVALIVLLVGTPCSLAFRQPPPTDTSGEIGISDHHETQRLVISRDTDGQWLSEMIRRDTDDLSPRDFSGKEKESIWSDSVFILYMTGLFLKSIGYVFPFVHLVPFMLNIGLSSSTAAMVMVIKGSADVLGRLVAGNFGGRVPFPLINIYVACTGIMALTTVIGIFATNLTHMVVYATSIGFFNGVYNSLLYAVTTSLFEADRVGDAWSYCQVPPGIAICLGPGFAGIIFDLTHTYKADFLTNSVVFLGAMAIFSYLSAVDVTGTVIGLRKGGPTSGQVARTFFGVTSRRDDDEFDDEVHVIVRSDSDSDG